MSRPERLDAIAYVGRWRYHLTACTHKRARHFINRESCESTLSQFLRVGREESFEVVVYCFMPDHLHAVVDGKSDSADFRRFVRLAKLRSGYWFSRATGARLWQEGYFDHVLREDEDLVALVEYVIGNPVRAHLVTTPAEYPYWGSQVYSREEVLDLVAGRSRI